MGFLSGLLGGVFGKSGGSGQFAGAEQKFYDAKQKQDEWAGKLAGLTDPLMNYGKENYGATMTGATGAANRMGGYANQLGNTRLERNNPALGGAYNAMQNAQGSGQYLANFNPTELKNWKPQLGPMRQAYELAKQEAQGRMAREGTAGGGIEQATMRGLQGDYSDRIARANADMNAQRLQALSDATKYSYQAKADSAQNALGQAQAAQGLAGLEDTWARAANDATLQALQGAMQGYGSQGGLLGQLGQGMAGTELQALGLNQDMVNQIAAGLQALGGMKAGRAKEQQGYDAITGAGIGKGIENFLMGGF